jgi:nucleotide-binding universal stress UspA family protein
VTSTEQDRAVVVGVDGAESADLAVHWGAAEAVRREVPLRLVTAFPWRPGESGHLQHGDAYRRELLHERELHLARVAQEVGEVVPDVDVSHRVVVGEPIAVLGAESRRAGTLVIGDRGLGALAGVLVGSSAVALARGAGCPVVVVRGDGAPAADLPVVVGVDGTPTSEDALAFAFDAASSRRVPLVAVHAWWADLHPTLQRQADLRATLETEGELLAERLAGWSEKYPAVTVSRVLSRRPATEVLLAQGAHAQLVVVGCGGRGALAGLVLGSVSQALLHHCACPVAVVRPRG